MQFRDRLYQLRKSAGLTQAELADRIQVSRQTISKWEMGNGIPDTINMCALGKVFQVSVDYLLEGKAEDESNAAVEKTVKKQRNNVMGLKMSITIFICTIIVGFIVGNVRHSFMSTMVFFILLGSILLIFYGVQLLKHFLFYKNEK